MSPRTAVQQKRIRRPEILTARKRHLLGALSLEHLLLFCTVFPCVGAFVHDSAKTSTKDHAPQNQIEGRSYVSAFRPCPEPLIPSQHAFG